MYINIQERVGTVEGHLASVCASVFSTWVQALLRLGVDVSRLEAQWGIPLARLRQPNLRLPTFLTRRFWEVAVEISGDEVIGLHAGGQGELAQMHGLNYLMRLSPTRVEGLRCMQRFLPTLAGHLLVQLATVDGQLVIDIEPSLDLRMAPEESDYWLAQHINYLCGAQGSQGVVREVQMRRPRPVDPQPWQGLVQAPIHFGCKQDRMVLDLEALKAPCEVGSPEVRAALIQALERYECSDLPSSSLELVANTVLNNLGEDLSIEAVAQRLHMTSRTLHRALLKEGWSFSGIVEMHRRYLAIDWLQDGGLTVAEIGDRLGYKDHSSFIRAFRRWYGMAPTAFRQDS